MISFGIDLINFYAPNYYLDLVVLANARGVAAEKLFASLGQKKMAIIPPDEDIVTMGANAADRLLQKMTQDEKASISMVLFATESGIDFSKSAGIYVHKLLNLPNHCRVIELKQACYSATAGLQMALAWIKQNPDKKVLLIASDVARYDLDSAAETSQGSGAVAMVLGANPRVLAIDPECGFYSEEAMDFWRPNYRNEAIVDGKYSCEVFIHLLEECWREYFRQSQRSFIDHDYFCYHIPVPKLAEMAHRRLAKISGANLDKNSIEAKVCDSLHYSREVGNCYTASLYIGILSLLDNLQLNLAGKRLGLYSYGSGSSGEFFSATVVDKYSDHLFTDTHRDMLSKRQALSYEQYLEFYKFKLPEDGSLFVTPKFTSGKFRLAGVDQHKRNYSLS